MKTPVTIYVVHHPDCKEAKELASGLFHWFRLSYLSGESNVGTAGLPVYFRRQLDGPELVPEIRFDEAEHNIVILLVDHQMVSQPKWLKAVIRLADTVRKNKSTDCRSLMLPVALHDSFYRTGRLYQNFNPIRLLDLNSDEREMVLRRSTTEAIARAMRANDDGKVEPLKVFLSHAKRDGKDIAEALRDGIRSFSQLEAWYDANDLPYGAKWASPMIAAAKTDTAAMISMVTDAYPTRPWCRHEAMLAREPVQIPRRPRVWKVQPVVAVHHPKTGWVRGVSMLEGVPRIGWQSRPAGDQIERIVDRLVLEVLLATVHRKLAVQIEKDDRKQKSRHEESCYLTWVPDAWTLSSVREKLESRASVIKRIVYPGYGLTTAEKTELKPVLSGFHADTKLVSYEEA